MSETIWATTSAQDEAPLEKAWSPERGQFAPDPALLFVASGDVALTRKLSKVASFVVMMTFGAYSRRIGVMATREQLDEAKRALAETEAQRAAARERSRARRNKKERARRDEFAAEIRRQFPRIPDRDLRAIIDRALEVGSGRVGRSTQIDLPSAARAAVVAHVRHNYTDYDQRLKDREFEYIEDARAAVRGKIDAVLKRWSAAQE